MEQIRLGRTELLISKAGFGSIPIQRVSEQAGMALIHRALELGMNWIDTAHGYGTSEERVGRALQSQDRSNVYIFTKGPGKSPELIRKQIQLSLERLQTDTIDLYQFHMVPDPDIWLEMQKNGTLDTVLSFRDKGIIRHIGASAHTLAAALAVLDHPDIEVIQWPFNFLVEKDGLTVLEKCKSKDIGFIGMKPFAGGVLNDARLCVRYLNQFETAALDPGFEKLSEIEQVVAHCQDGGGLSKEDQQRIDEHCAELGTRFCRRCGYCMPCPHGVNIITLMTLESLIKRFPADMVINGWPAEAVKTVDRCIECGECEEKCPYKLPIMKGIRSAAQLHRELAAEHS